MLMADPNIELRYRLLRGGHESNQIGALQGNANRVMRQDLVEEVLTLLFKGMRIRDSNAVLEAGAPHGDQLGESGGLVLFQQQWGKTLQCYLTNEVSRLWRKNVFDPIKK